MKFITREDVFKRKVSKLYKRMPMFLLPEKNYDIFLVVREYLHYNMLE